MWMIDISKKFSVEFNMFQFKPTEEGFWNFKYSSFLKWVRKLGKIFCSVRQKWDDSGLHDQHLMAGLVFESKLHLK